MSRIGDLRANEENNLNLVKILELFSGGETKYVEMLLKLYKTIGDTTEIKVNTISARTGIDVEKIKVLSENEIDYLFSMCENTIFLNSIKYFNKFREYNEQNLIEEKNLHTYKTFDQVIDSVKIAYEKVTQKELEKSIEKVHDDKEWLILIPLTYEASVKYGYNTKWCTSSESTAEQYKSYTKDGVLIYIIQKNKSKTAAYKRIDRGEISFWDQKDNRIDSLQCNFPTYIMEIVSEKLRKSTKPTHDPKDFVKSSDSILGNYSKGISGVSNITGMSGTSGYANSYGLSGNTFNGNGLTDHTEYTMSIDPIRDNVYKDDFAPPIIAKKSFSEHFNEDNAVLAALGFGSLNESDRILPSNRYTHPEPNPNFNDLVQNQGYLDRVKSLMRKLR